MSAVLAAGLMAGCGPSDTGGGANASELARGEDAAVVTTSASTAALEAELMRLEREFSAASGREGASAWSSRWAPNGRSYSGGAELVGPEAVHEAMAPVLEQHGDRFTWGPDTAVVAASGDLGYTLGSYAITDVSGDTLGRGHYVTVWQRQRDGNWKIAVDIGT